VCDVGLYVPYCFFLNKEYIENTLTALFLAHRLPMPDMYVIVVDFEIGDKQKKLLLAVPDC